MDQQTGHVGLRKLNKLLVRILYPKADLIIAVSQGVKQSLINLGIEEEKIKVIYNPYPIDEIRELAKEPLGSYEEIFKHPVLITAGRLTKQKGQWYLLRIFKALKEKHKDLKLVILGEGELKEYLVKLSEELGLKTYVWDRDKLSESFDVYFLGFQKNPFKFIARSKLFVFPSLWEGFPNALVESMACSVYVVSSDCKSGPREILAPNTDFNYQTQKPEFAEYGVLMPVFEVKYKTAKEPLEEREIMWVETIDKLLEDESLRKSYSERAKQRAEDFRIEKIVQEWKGFIYDV
jgi:glycosyltransferase involved in cell wall biosynthesis